MCRSRRELSNAYLLAKIGVDTAENEPLEVWGENSIGYSLHSLLRNRVVADHIRRTALAIHEHLTRRGLEGNDPNLGSRYLFLSDLTNFSNVLDILEKSLTSGKSF